MDKIFNFEDRLVRFAGECIFFVRKLEKLYEIEYYKTLNYDTLDKYWQASNNQKHTLNISGGTDKATFFAGASYYQQGGNLSNID